MCTRIVVVDALPAAAIAAWDPDDVAILVRAGVDGEVALQEVCAILADLDAQPPFRGAPRCWCGSAVPLPAELAAAARRRNAHARQQHGGQVSRGTSANS